MRKLLFLFLLLPTLAWGQQATTTVQVTAAMGVGYSSSPVFLHQITFAGTGTPGYSTFFDAGGNLNILVPGGTYQFTFCNTAGTCFNASTALVTNVANLTTLFTNVAATTGGVSSVNGRTGAITILSGDIPNNAANTSGTAANLSGTPLLPNGTTATTQVGGDTSNDVATDSFVIGNGGTGSATNPAAPIMGTYLSNTCPPANNGQCFFTQADTQQQTACSWSSGSAVITCFSQIASVTASVTSNVATYTGTIPASWASLDSITISNFTNADTFFNQTCTISAVTSTTVTCPLTHANASSTTVGVITNSNRGPFVAGDVGKRAFGYQTCTAFQNLSVNTNNGPITTGTALTIQTFTSATQVSLSGNAATTVTLQTGFPLGGCFIYGHPDDAGAAAMDTAMQSATQCPRPHLAAGYYIWTTPHFFTIPPSCALLGATAPGTNAGNMFYAAGYELEGRGTGATQVFVTPGFPETGSCTHGKSAKACFVVATEGRWLNFSINGGGNFRGYNIPANTNLIEIDGPASLDNFTCINWASDSSFNFPNNGIAAYLWSQLVQVNNSACGQNGIVTNVSSSMTGIKVSVDNPNNHGIEMGTLADFYTQSVPQFDRYNLTCYDCSVYAGAGTKGSAYAFISNKSQSAKFYHLRFGIFTVPTINGIVGYQCTTAATCTLDVEDGQMDMSGNGSNTATGTIAIQCTFNCNNYLKNTTVKGTTGGSAYTDTAGSKLFDLGGNTFGAVTISGGLFGSTSITGTTQTSGNFAISPASSATFSAVTGNSLNGQVTVTWAGTPATTETITMTFPTTFLVAPRCTVVDVGGNNPFPTAIDTTNTATTTTTLTIKETFAVAPTVGNTNLFVWNCSN